MTDAKTEEMFDIPESSVTGHNMIYMTNFSDKAGNSIEEMSEIPEPSVTDQYKIYNCDWW